MVRISSILLLLAASFGAKCLSAQTLSLERAVQLGIEQSIAVQQQSLDLENNHIVLRTDKWARLPNLNATVSGGAQFGLNVDPSTNDLVQEQITFNNLGMNAGVPLFQGGRLAHRIKRSKFAVAAAEANLENTRQQVALTVARNYLEVLLAEEELQAVRSRLRQTRQESERIEQLIAAGQQAPTERFELAAQQARQEQQLVQAHNAAGIARLRLRQLLQLDQADSLKLVELSPETAGEIELPTLSSGEIFQTALDRQPGIRAARLAEEAAEEDIQVAKAGYYPSVQAFASLATRYSSAARELASADNVILQEQQVFINGQPVTIGTQVVQPEFRDKPYLDQLRDFFGQSVGLRLNIPIFSNGQVRSAVEQARLRSQQQALQTRERTQSFEQEVRSAYQAATAARAELAAATASLEAAEQAYQAARRRADAGAGDSYAVLTAQLLFEQAQITVLRAKYQYLFNAKVIDFYLGKPLTLD